MKHSLLGNSGLRVSENLSTRLAFAAIALAIGVFLSGCATAPKPAKAGKLYHVGPVWLKETRHAVQRAKLIAVASTIARDVSRGPILCRGQQLSATSSWADA